MPVGDGSLSHSAYKWTKPEITYSLTFELEKDGSASAVATERTARTGKTVRLGDYFGERPVVLAFVYYECPMLCNQILNGLVSGVGVLDQTVGTDFDVVAISFDARETPTQAAAKKATYLDRYQRPGSERGWHFLTGDEATIKRVTDTAGFQFAWDLSLIHISEPTRPY